jgi:hypothetical protein
LKPSENAKVRLSCGRKARDEGGGSLTGGDTPDLVLYDTLSEEIARQIGGSSFVLGNNPIIDLSSRSFESGKSTRTPKLVTLIVRGDDAICVGYLVVTVVGDDKWTPRSTWS